MHGPKSKPSSADLPMPDLLKDRLLISIANRWWAKEAELLFCNKLGKPKVRNKVALKLQETLKGLGIAGCRASRLSIPAPRLETSQALGIHFVSLSELLDTSTPAGKMVFTLLGAVAELARSLIVERVKAGLRNARGKGKRLGRPRVNANVRRIATLRDRGASWATVCRETGLSKGTAQRTLCRVSEKTQSLKLVNPTRQHKERGARLHELSFQRAQSGASGQ